MQKLYAKTACIRTHSATQPQMFVHWTPVVKNPPANAGAAGNMDSIGSGRFPGVGNGNPLQYSCLRESHTTEQLSTQHA